MKLVGIVFTTALLSFSCGSPVTAEDLTEIKTDLALVRSEIQSAQTDDARYTGGLVKALIASRTATLRQTEAMLNQKLVSLRTGATVKYSIDGKAFSLPAAASQMLADVESEIGGSREKIQRQEAEVARFSGGLALAMSLATLETMRQTHAMLEQKRVALKYALPQYIGFVGADNKEVAGGTASPDARGSAVIPAKQKTIAGELRNAITLAVIEKGFMPSDPSGGRYENFITMKCSYENASERDIRAFTGTIVFQDLFGKEILKSTVTISDPILARQRATWNGSIKYNQFVDSHQRLRAAELRDMNVVWLPASIIFSDGTKMEDSSGN